MKIDRSQVEIVLADATVDPVSRWHVNDTFNRELVAELARAWLALDAAPVGEVHGQFWDRAPKNGAPMQCLIVTADTIEPRWADLHSQRVRLVAAEWGVA